MDEKTVRKLEKRIEKAILEVISDMRLKRLPLLPSQLTMHLRAKAAVGAYDAAVGNDHPEHPRREQPTVNRLPPRATPLPARPRADR